MRYWYLDLNIQCGEYEFKSKSVHSIKSKKEFDGEAYAQAFYGDPDEQDEDSGIYYFNHGEIAVCVNNCEEISKEEYDVLYKFL